MTTPTTVNARFQLRADTAANWASVNPTLLANELGLETDTKKLKVGNGSTAWNSLGYFPSIVSGGTVLGNLEIGTTGTLTFEGSTANGFETTLAVTDPTADRTITLPDQSGTVVVSGNASITNADIAANAEIAVSKLANGTANQVIVTDGTNVSWSDDLTLAGNLTVNGTTTTINTQDLLVEDKNIIIGNVGTPSDVTADGGGITLKGATDKTINWVDSTDAWTSSERFSVPLGSAGAPSLTFTGDANTGIYSPGADQVALSTNGTGRLFVDSSGRVGIGTTSPGNPLSVVGYGNATSGWSVGNEDGNTSGYFVSTGSSSNSIEIAADPNNAGANSVMQFSVDGSERARIDSSGRLLVGTSSALSNVSIAGTLGAPTYQIQGATGAAASASITRTTAGSAFFTFNAGSSGNNVVSGNGLGLIQFNGFDGTNYINGASIGANVDGTPGANDMPGRIVLSTTADGASSPTERMRITSGGQVFIDRTSNTASGTLEVYGNSDSAFNPLTVVQGAAAGSPSRTSISFYRTSASAQVGSITTTNSATAFNTSSDYRLKENVTPVADGITRLQQLKPSRFNFIADPGKTVDGFIAHEVQDVVPEAITGEKDAVDEDGNPIYQGIDQSKLVPLLTAALQEAVAKIESLEARLTAAGI